MDAQKIDDKREALVRRIRKFPQQDRRYIIGSAILDLDRDLTKPYGPDRYSILKKIAEQATGHPLTEHRTRGNTDIRTILAKTMRIEGYTMAEIGTYMGRDHSTVSYYITTMDFAIEHPIYCADLIEKYNTFVKLKEEYDKRNL